MAFDLCLNTSTIMPQPLLEKIRLAGEAGFDGVELWVADVEGYVRDGGDMKDVQSALRDAGLFVPSTIAMKQWGEAPDENYREALDDARRRMEVAAALGATYIVATPPTGPAELSRLVGRYHDLLELGRDVGVRPTFEYISFFASVSTVAQAWEVVQRVDHPDATLVLDAFHTYNGGSTHADIEAIPAERISHYHIDDASPEKPLGEQRDPDRVMPGDGPLDLAADMRLLRELGYGGAISLELFNEALRARDPREVLGMGVERMRRVVPRA